MDLQGQCWRRWDGWCWNKCSCWAVYWRRSRDWRTVLLQVWAIDDQSTEQHWIQPKVSSWVLWNSFPKPGRACWWHSRQAGADVLWARRLVCTLHVWCCSPPFDELNGGELIVCVSCVCLVWFTIYYVSSVSVCLSVWFALVQICLV